MDAKQLAKNLIFCVIAALLAIAGVFFLLNNDKPALGAAQPRITPTPSPTPEPMREVVDIVPTATPITVQAVVEIPEDAVDVLVNGSVVMAVESAEEAERALNDYLATFSEVGENQRLVRAYTEQKVELTAASGSVEILNYSGALSRLISNPALLSVTQVITSCVAEEDELRIQTQQNAQLPLNNTFIAVSGASERYIVYYESVYKSGVECSYAETNRFKVSEEVPRIIQNGTYFSDAEESQEGEGQIGPQVETLRFRCPIEGTLVSYFGMSGGIMNNGIDFEANAGTNVVAPEGGVVIYCGTRGDYGFVVDIMHDEGGLVTRLTNLDEVRVELYQRVRRGELIGVLASTGTNEKPILHLELLINNIPYDPLQYIPKR
ncbi:MAG: M23 family metallopeptidase [Clostridia bacterium]|nr:M23 family metallopeptidase [Clostridia bacterium]